MSTFNLSADETSRQIHHRPAVGVFALLHTRRVGLTSSEVETRTREVGRNTIERPRHHRWLKMLAKHFTNFFSLLLVVSAVLSFLAEWLRAGESMLVLGWALLGVAFLNGAFAFAQEYRAERAMEELKKLLPQRITVRRNGTEREIHAEDLVPGDVILIQEGVKVPGPAPHLESLTYFGFFISSTRLPCPS